MKRILSRCEFSKNNVTTDKNEVMFLQVKPSFAFIIANHYFIAFHTDYLAGAFFVSWGFTGADCDLAQGFCAANTADKQA